MGFLDKLLKRARQSAPEMTEKAQDFAAQHGEKVVDGIHKAGDFAGEKTGGKSSESIDKAESTVEDAVEKLAGEKKAPEPSPPGGAPPA